VNLLKSSTSLGWNGSHSPSPKPLPDISIPMLQLTFPGYLSPLGGCHPLCLLHPFVVFLLQAFMDTSLASFSACYVVSLSSASLVASFLFDLSFCCSFCFSSALDLALSTSIFTSSLLHHSYFCGLSLYPFSSCQLVLLLPPLLTLSVLRWKCGVIFQLPLPLLSF
jgi:hypothetical protein